MCHDHDEAHCAPAFVLVLQHIMGVGVGVGVGVGLGVGVVVGVGVGVGVGNTLFWCCSAGQQQPAAILYRTKHSDLYAMLEIIMPCISCAVAIARCSCQKNWYCIIACCK